MNANEIFKAMVKKASTLSVDDLKAQAAKYMTDFSDDANVMFTVMLTALENKISESEYIEFCDSL